MSVPAKGDGGRLDGAWARRESILIACVRDAAPPRAEELDGLGRRIWEEVEGRRAAGWTTLPRTSAAYRRTMRLAAAALQGCPKSGGPG